MNHTHLTSIACGLFHYKFPMRIAEEISYHSKISGEVSALFNFSLDEMQNIKNHYMRLLKYNEHEQGVKQYSQASIHHSLGDTYIQEENYSDAIREYEKAWNMSCRSSKTGGRHTAVKLHLFPEPYDVEIRACSRKTQNRLFRFYRLWRTDTFVETVCSDISNFVRQYENPALGFGCPFIYLER